MKRIFYLMSVFLTLSTFGLRAQSYGTAAGVRIGDGIGLTVQQQIGEKATLEMIAESAFKSKDVTFSAIYEQHANIIPFVRMLNVYYGGGPHFKSVSANSTEKNGYGVTAIVGAELKLGNFLFSVDFKPLMNVSGGTGFFETQKGFSVRYVLLDRIKSFSLLERLKKF
jgi:hypothetical protein